MRERTKFDIHKNGVKNLPAEENDFFNFSLVILTSFGKKNFVADFSSVYWDVKWVSIFMNEQGEEHSGNLS